MSSWCSWHSVHQQCLMVRHTFVVHRRLGVKTSQHVPFSEPDFFAWLNRYIFTLHNVSKTHTNLRSEIGLK